MLELCRDADAVAHAAARRVLVAGEEALKQRGAFRLGLSGGRTPQASYRLLAAQRFDWSGVEILFADERAVPPDAPESNYRMASETLLAPAGIPDVRVHRMQADVPDLEAAAEAYAALLATPLDVLVLGIGEDGHTASLFPGSPLLTERARSVAPVFDSPKPPLRRLTITPPVIAAARSVLVLATGRAKADAVARALGGAEEAAQVPARLARERTWLVDRAAASALPTRGSV